MIADGSTGSGSSGVLPVRGGRRRACVAAGSVRRERRLPADRRIRASETRGVISGSETEGEAGKRDRGEEEPPGTEWRA